MSRQRFYIVHGMGNDAVGLVGNITTPIASAGGNIVDLRQDVLHGLFTIYMVVDLTDCELRIDAFKDIIKSIAEDTGLQLSVDTYHPIARNPEKKNILMILVGYDKPGIIASISQTLGNYKANIEFAQNIAREGIFLMELLIDVSYCTLPLDNLKSIVTQKMSEMEITAMFQTKDVFNKKKRIILFDISHSLIPANTVTEILQQTRLTPEDLASTYPKDNVVTALTKAAQLLEGLPADVINTLANDIQIEAGTTELLQTLKIMGYKICVVCNGFSVFVDAVTQKIGLDYSYGVELEINEDSRTVRTDRC
jgi:phosphoserine phosphatase